MQGITVALFFEGIKQWVEGICAPVSYLEKSINNTSLNDYSITDGSLGEAWIGIDGTNAKDCTQIDVYLSQGTISNFTISSSGSTIQQQPNGTFLLSFSSGAAFSANYKWNETWSQQDEYYDDNSGNWVPQGNPYGQQAGPFNFSLGVGSLDTTATFTFKYDSNSNTWQLPVTSVTTSPSNPTPNIPGGSVLQHSTSQGCNAQIHLEQGAVDSLDKGDDFHVALTNGVFNHPLASIPASGQLTPDITFAFGLGDSPVTFPNNQGVTVGVTGIATYKGQPYPENPPTGLPVPSTVQPLPLLFGGIPASEAANFDAKNISDIISDFKTYSPQIIPDPNYPDKTVPKYPLTDPTVTVITPGSEWQVLDSSNNTWFQVQLNTQKNTLDVYGLYHLQMYVSDYTINGLYWAFFMDNQLNVTVTPANTGDPNILKVRTWSTTIRELQKYNALDMQITIAPTAAPIVTFQTVYLFTQTVMNNLNNPNNPVSKIYSLITGMLGNVYPNQGLLEQDLTNIYGVDPQYFQEIEKTAGTPGAAVFHSIQFNVTIPEGTPINGQAPFMEFTVNRYDVLENLGLAVTDVPINGKTQKVQTLTFGFNAGTNSVSVIFNQSNFLSQSMIGDFGTQIWPQACEDPYDKALDYMGQKGAPLPIMQGFQFLFEQAQLSIQVNNQNQPGFVGILSNVKFTG